MSSPKLRICHFPTNTGGNPYGLARAERRLGLESHCVVVGRNHYDYPADEIIEGSNALILTVKKILFFIKALRRYDVIHINFGQSFFPRRLDPNGYARLLKILIRLVNLLVGSFEGLDLLIIKNLRKGLVVTYQGNDARQGEYIRRAFPINVFESVRKHDPYYYTPIKDMYRKQRIAKFDKFADAIFALNPDLMHVLPKRTGFMPYAHVDLSEWVPTYNQNSCGLVRVIHAPSHRGFKGTDQIVDVINSLRSDGLEFEFRLIEGVSNAEARKLYETADLLIDQLWAGWYGGLALELMALGKPVMCYIRESDLDFIPEKMKADLPIINVTSETLYDDLKQWLTVNKNELPSLGLKSRKYVENWHDPDQVALMLKETYLKIFSKKFQ